MTLAELAVDLESFKHTQDDSKMRILNSLFAKKIFEMKDVNEAFYGQEYPYKWPPPGVNSSYPPPL